MLKRLKTGLAAVSVAILMAFGTFAGFDAYAAWNLRQNPNGSADFVPTPSGLGASRIGRAIITHTIPNIGISATHYILSPITGRLRSVMLIPDSTLASAITISVFLDHSPTSQSFTALAPTARIAAAAVTGVGSIIPALFRRSTGGTTLYSDSEWAANGTTGFIDKAAVKQFRPIIIRIDNAAGDSHTANVVVIVDPE